MAYGADGKRVKQAEPMYRLIPSIMKKRYDAMNMVTVDVVDVPCMPMGIVMDARICPGSYFSQAFRRWIAFLSDPALLETWPDESAPTPEKKPLVFEEIAMAPETALEG